MAEIPGPCPGDSDNSLLRKILNRLATAFSVSIGNIQLSPSDFEIGAVELKDADTDNRVAVIDVCPSDGMFGVVTRNINCGVQDVAVVSSVPIVVSGTVSISGTVTTSGLTDAELRASPVPVIGPLTDAELRASPVPVTDTQLVTVNENLTSFQSSFEELKDIENGASVLRVQLEQGDALCLILGELRKLQKQLAVITDLDLSECEV